MLRPRGVGPWIQSLLSAQLAGLVPMVIGPTHRALGAMRSGVGVASIQRFTSVRFRTVPRTWGDASAVRRAWLCPCHVLPRGTLKTTLVLSPWPLNATLSMKAAWAREVLGWRSTRRCTVIGHTSRVLTPRAVTVCLRTAWTRVPAR